MPPAHFHITVILSCTVQNVYWRCTYSLLGRSRQRDTSRSTNRKKRRMFLSLLYSEKLTLQSLPISSSKFTILSPQSLNGQFEEYSIQKAALGARREEARPLQQSSKLAMLLCLKIYNICFTHGKRIHPNSGMLPDGNMKCFGIPVNQSRSSLQWRI